MTINGTLAETGVKFGNKNACCVIMASRGYPVKYDKGYEITIPDNVSDNVYVAGVELKDGKLLTNGGRVLGVTAVAETLKGAIDEAYSLVNNVHFDNAFYRNDIGEKAMRAEV